MSCNYCHNSNSARWALGAFLALLGLTGLYLAAHTAGGGFYMHGLGLFGLSVLGVFRLIKATFDDGEKHHHTGTRSH